MYQRIKTLADEAVALQNKDRMDAALREISALTMAQMEAEAAPKAMSAEQFEAAELAQHQDARGMTGIIPAAKRVVEEKSPVVVKKAVKK